MSFADQPVAEYHNGMKSGIKRLFPVNLTVADGTGPVLDDEEWWRGAWLATNDTSGTLTVANPFGQGDVPDDAVLTLEVEEIIGQTNPFTSFSTLSWIAEAPAGLGQPISLTAPTNSGAAAFVLTLTSDKYGLLGKDRVKVNVGSVNLIIDSLNQYGYDIPVDSEEVAEVEDDSDEPGKIIVVNDGDGDNDGIPGFADGYGLFDLPEYQTSTNTPFVPIIFELPKPIDLARARIRLSYDVSAPLGVTTNSTGEHLLPESGKLRLWIKDGDEPRGGKAVIDGGDIHIATNLTNTVAEVGVMALGGTLPGTCIPTVERVKGLCTITVTGDTFTYYSTKTAYSRNQMLYSIEILFP